jgi:hypothetical protein
MQTIGISAGKVRVSVEPMMAAVVPSVMRVPSSVPTMPT